MRTISNERGVALVTALLLTLISLAIVLAVLYFIMQQTQLSAASKRYKSSLEAAHGGVEVFTKDIIPFVFSGMTSLPTRFANIGLTQNVTGPDMYAKLTQNTADWPATARDLVRPLDPKSRPDFQFILRGLPMQPGFAVYSKLVDTQKGNSDISGYELLDPGAGVAYSNSGVTPQHIPAIYRIEVQGESATNPLEKAALTVLYAY